MKHKNTTKRTLALSLLVMLMCVAMLVGTTFAWFTDSATSSGNKIEAGTLNIDLLVKNAAGEYQSVKEEMTAIFDYDMWEPGYTEVRNVMVSTTGNLALKYTLSIVPKSSTTPADLKLAEVIDVYYASSEVNVTDRNLTGLTRIGTLKDVLNGVEGTVINDTLIPDQQNTVDYATIALKMQESAGNDYQGLSVGEGFDLNLVATQYTYEEDSFDNQYDANAGYPVVAEVSDKDSLNDALNHPGVPVSITLTETIGSSSNLTVTGDVTLNLGQNRLNKSNMESVGADLTVNNGGSLVINATSPEGRAYNAGKLMADGSGSSLTVNGGAYGDSGYRNADVTARNGSVVYLNSGSFSTSGSEGHAVTAESGATVHINSGSFSTSGAYGHAVTAESGATVYISGGSFSTSGYQSSTIYANGGTIVITGLDSISANGFNYDVDNGGTIILSKTVSSSQPTRIGTGCTVTEDGDNWVITKA